MPFPRSPGSNTLDKFVKAVPNKNKRLMSEIESEEEETVKEIDPSQIKTIPDLVIWLAPMKKDMKNLVDDLEIYKKKVKDLEEEVKVLKDNITDRDSKLMAVVKGLDNITDEVRRNNLIIHGIDDAVPDHHLHEVINDLFSYELEIAVSFDEPFRLGRRQEGKNRPVKIKMQSSADRSKVLQNKRFLPNQVKVTEDLCLSSRQRKQEMWNRKFNSNSRFVLPPATTLPTTRNTTATAAKTMMSTTTTPTTVTLNPNTSTNGEQLTSMETSA